MVTRKLGQVWQHVRKHAEWYWAPVLYFTLVCILYRVVFSGEFGFGWDSSELYWPNLKFLSDSLADGEFPLWNPYNRGGHPVYADPSQGATYPLHWFLAALTYVTDFGFGVFQFGVLLHHALGGMMMHLYLRSRGLDRSAALVGGLAWMGSTPMLIHKASNIIWPMIWLPLLWLAIDRLVTRPSWRSGAGLAGAIYLAGSAGSPPGFFYLLVAAVLYGGFRVASHWSSVPRPWCVGRRAEITATVWALVVAAAGTFALLTITVLPTTQLIAHTARAGRPVAFALSLPLAVGETLRGMVVPSLARPDIYLGMGALFLAVVALVARPQRDRQTPLFFAGAAAFFLILAFGPHTPVLPWLAQTVPGFRMFRISSRYRLLFAPMFAALAAYGGQAVLDIAKSQELAKRLPALASVLTVLVVVIFFAVFVDGPAQPSRSPVSIIVIGCLAASLVVGALFHQPPGATLLITAIAISLVFDAAYFQFAKGPVMERVPRPESATILNGLDGISDRWRIYDEFAVGHRVGSRRKVRDFRGYPAGDQLQLLRYADILKLGRSHPEILEAFNVRYILQKRHPRTGYRTSFVPRPPGPHYVKRTTFVKKATTIYEAIHPVDLVRWYGALRVAEPRSVLAAMLELEDPEGHRDVAIVEPRDLERLSEQAKALVDPRRNRRRSVGGTLISYRRNQIVVRIEAPEAGIVVLNELFYDGWKVFVDGRATEPIRANYLLRGVEVSPGPHEIVWQLRPPKWRWYLAGFIGGQLLLIGAWFSIRRRRLATQVD